MLFLSELWSEFAKLVIDEPDRLCYAFSGNVTDIVSDIVPEGSAVTVKVITIKDIAKLAGVSVTTVSRVLNHRPDVNPATREMVERMIRKGRKRFAYIGVFEEDRAAGYCRREGLQEALREAGLDADNVPRRVANFTAESGYEAMMELLAEDPAIDAVMCATDVIAHGAMKALKETGRSIPGDVSIAGVGDNWADLMSEPTLSTVKLQQRQCGREAARMLLRLIGEEAGDDSRGGDRESSEDPGNSAEHIMLGYTIIERDSI